MNARHFLSFPAAATSRLGRLGLLGLTFFAAASVARAGGFVLAWGDDSAGQCDVPATLGNNAVAVAAGGSHSLALKSDGTVAAWGANTFGQINVPPSLANVTAIAAGYASSIALKSDGTIAVWGALPLPPASVTNVIAIAAGRSHALAVLSDGTVVSWGSQTFVPAGLSSVIAVAAGSNTSLALRADGGVVAWGDNTFGKTNVPANLTNAIAIAAGWDHCMGLRRDGAVFAWGSNASGQSAVPASASNAVAIAAGGKHSIVITINSSLVAWGDDTYHQTEVPGGTGFFSVGAGGSHSLGVKGSGAPVIILQPISQNVVTNTGTAILQVLAAGVQPLGYRWTQNGANLPGATSATLVLSNFRISDGGSYVATVTNSLGTAVSVPAILTPICSAPVIVTPPLSQTTNCGDTAVFKVVTSGSGPLTYQWFKDGALILSAASATLTINNVSNTQAGVYFVIVGNVCGSTTSSVATLAVVVTPPVITSPLSAIGNQGVPFTYTITGDHHPTSFAASGLPNNLTLNPLTGVISGIPTNNGSFGPTITAFNACTSYSATLVLSFGSSAPVITSPTTVVGREAFALTYQITATRLPTSFAAQNLPVGLLVNPNTGLISGSPSTAGEFDSTITAANPFASGSTNLHFSITNAVPIVSMTLTNISTNYHSPYLLDFAFTLRVGVTNADGSLNTIGLVTSPTNLTATCTEVVFTNMVVTTVDINGSVTNTTITINRVPINTNIVTTVESGVVLARATSKLAKTYLVLDFTESIASTTLNGDTNNDGISDAVDSMVSGAQFFVNQQPADSQIGVIEFHREDQNPNKVIGLSTDHALVDSAIAGIWTNYVRGFPASSRCWDAVVAAISSLAPSNPGEQHYIIFVSDGQDESSTNTVDSVIAMASKQNVIINAIGFGPELDINPLTNITSRTHGQTFIATNSADIAAQFALVQKDIQAQYILRWASLNRTTNQIAPVFQIMYQDQVVTSPDDRIMTVTDNTDPLNPKTTIFETNDFIGTFIPTQYGPPTNVLVGALNLVTDAEVLPTGITLRADYVPRYIRQIRFQYRANWPCTVTLDSTNNGEMLHGWSLVATNDGAGGQWVLLSSPNPLLIGTSIPFADFGRLVTFKFNDVINPSNAFSLMAVDNSLYTNTGGQSFTFQPSNNLGSFTAFYPVLPHGTPVPWLIAHGFPNNFAAAELSDPDGDGIPTWEEYRANTDPQDPNSKFVIRMPLTSDSDGQTQVIFSSSLNRVYRVDSSFDLINWQTVRDNIPGIGADITIPDTRFFPGLTQIFYRVAVY